MRVSENSRFRTTVNRIEKAKHDNVRALDLLASQKKITKLHEDPVGAVSAIKSKKRLQDIEGFKRNVDFAKGFLDATESSLNTMIERLGRAYELGIAASNDTGGSEARLAISKEVNEITNQVIQNGNARYNGRFVFSGFRTKTPALDKDGVFLGDDGEIFIQVEQDNYRKINIPGRFIFEATPRELDSGHFNLVDALEVMRVGLESNDKGLIHQSVEEMTYHLDRLSSYQATLGAVYSDLEHAKERVDMLGESETKNLSNIEDADIYEVSSNFKRSEAILQSTLLASNKVLQPSLLNFMQ